jgi:hypothetical protein
MSAVAHPQVAQAQDELPPILSQAVARHDWDLRGVGDVRFGRVAVVRALDGPHLELRRLLETELSAPSRSVSGSTPAFEGNNLVVSDFAQGNRTPLGGYFGAFQRAPSAANASVARGPDGRRALELTCVHEGDGFCGLWVQLYDFEAPPQERSYLDARAFSTMSFWVRGHAGGERVLLKVADEEWERREDAAPVGDVSAFLSSGRIDTQWQQAVVALDRFPERIRRDLLAMIVFETLDPGTTTIDLGPMAFSLASDPLPGLPSPAAAEQPLGIHHKATWVWNTSELLGAPDRMIALFDFLESEGFDRVFLQLPGIPDQPSRPGELAIDTETMRPVVAALNTRGMKVYALDGFARYALPEFHEGVLATVDHVARYNRDVLPNERFHGVRYDIEPYLLPGFHGPDRERLLTGLLSLTEASVERAHAANLVYGADIPFWYDALPEDTYERITVRYGGAEKAVSEHIIDLVDEVAIMDYRTTAYGADGTIRHGTGELEYANERGKPVFIALETYAVPDETLLDFHGQPGVGLPESPPTDPFVVVAAGRDSIHTVLLPDPATEPRALDLVADWLEQNRLDPEDVRWWPVGRRVEVPASKITFANQGSELLDRVMRATAEEFGRYDSFAGFAIHHAQSYRALSGR